jgi:hypothetical protein
MNEKIRGLAAIAFALCLGACEQQTLPADTTAGAKPAVDPDAAEATDALNCKIEVVNGVEVPQGEVAGPVALPGKLDLRGWVILDHANRAPASVSLEFASAAKPGTVVHQAAAGERSVRPDVDQAFSAKPGSKTGFAALEAAADLPAGTYRVQVVGADSGNRYPCPHLAQVRVEAATAH